MIESFLIMLREGIEAALVIGIMLVVLQKTNRRDLETPVFWGLGAAIIASIIGAAALGFLPINEELYEGVLYWISGVFVASMMWWMHLKARTLKKNITDRVQKAVEATQSAKDIREIYGLGIFSFIMVFREGAETVMFLSAIAHKTDPVLSAIGSVIGLGLAIAFCVMFVSGSLHINLPRFFRITEIILGILVLQLFISGYYELVESGYFVEIESVISVVRLIHKSSSLISILIVAVAMIVWVMGDKKVAPDRTQMSEEEFKAALTALQKQKLLRIGTVASSLVIMIALAAYFVNYKLPEITGENGHHEIEHAESMEES